MTFTALHPTEIRSDLAIAASTASKTGLTAKWVIVDDKLVQTWLIVKA